jgi:hypothetical protein
MMQLVRPATTAAAVLLVLASCVGISIAAAQTTGTTGAPPPAPPVVPQLTRPAGATATTRAALEGMIADMLCVNARTAVDGADMWASPQDHSLGCLITIQACVDSGYCLLQRQASATGTGLWGCAYTFTANETVAIAARLAALVANPGARNNLNVRVGGTWASETRFAVDVASLEFTTPSLGVTTNAPSSAAAGAGGASSLMFAAVAAAVAAFAAACL